MDKLTKDEVMHIAYLKLLDDVEKINNVKGYDDELMFSPITHNAPLREDVEGKMLDYKTVMKNVPHSTGNFVEVPVMLNE